MSTQKAPVGHDFAAVIAEAQRLPEAEEHGRDLPDGFPFRANPAHRVVNELDPDAIPGVVAYDFKLHRQVFTIYRSWEGCSRCMNAIASQQAVVPQEKGDYTCPHNNKQEYETICNQILEGKLIFGSEQEVVQKDGTIVVSLRWYEKKYDHKKARAAAKRLEREVATRTSEDPD